MNDRSKACLQVFLSWAKFSVLHNERGQQVDENDINNFFQKTFWSKWTILGPKMVHIHNSRSAVRIRWVTHLSMSLFPSFHLPVCLSVSLSVHPSVAHHISRTVHHLIIIFGTHV